MARKLKAPNPNDAPHAAQLCLQVPARLKSRIAYAASVAGVSPSVWMRAALVTAVDADPAFATAVLEN